MVFFDHRVTFDSARTALAAIRQWPLPNLCPSTPASSLFQAAVAWPFSLSLYPPFIIAAIPSPLKIKATCREHFPLSTLDWGAPALAFTPLRRFNKATLRRPFSFAYSAYFVVTLPAVIKEPPQSIQYIFRSKNFW